MAGFLTFQFRGSLGGGIPGGQPPSGLIGGGAGVDGGSGMEGGASRSNDRTILRRAMVNNYSPNAPITSSRI